MALTTTQRREAAREWVRRIFTADVMATLNLDDLVAAIGSIDDTMDALPATLNPLTSVKTNFLANLPQPFKGTATPQQKAIALTCWAMKEAGLI